MKTSNGMNKKINLFVLVLVMVLGFFNTVYADTTIHLEIQNASGSIYNQDIAVAPCDSDNAGTMAITAYCAILQSGISSDWSWYGTDAFANSIGGVANDYVDNIYWSWFHDFNYGSTALSAHTLTEGEHILLTFNINPLKLTVSDSNPTQHDTVIITLSQFSLDSNFNPVWSGASYGAITINENSHTVDGDGTYGAVMEMMVPYIISGNKTGFINSNSITLNPTRAVSSGGGGSSVMMTPVIISTPVTTPVIEIEEELSFDHAKAFTYLISQQKEDGSFGEDLYTDWATLALVTRDNQEQVLKLVKYFSGLKNTNTRLTDYQRHAMGLMALGLNPYQMNGVNYIEEIVNSFDGKQFGSVDEDNDDIFALIVLQNAGYTKDDKMIKDGVAFILSAQKEDGSWDGSVDMTGAGIESLAIFSSIDGVRESLLKAKEFLKQNQKDDGGWGNVSATAWAMQGILALGEKTEDWIKNDNTPLDYLSLNQDEDGGMKNDNVNSKIWETSYALTSLSGKTWNQIMQKFEKQEVAVVENEVLVIEKEIEIAKIPEVKKTETKKVTKTTKTESVKNISQNVKKLENIATQNTASSITALTDIPVKVNSPEPASRKSWIRRFFDIIFSF